MTRSKKASEKGGGRTGTGFLCGCGDGRELVRAEESRNQSQFQPHSEGDQYGSGSGLWFQHHLNESAGLSFEISPLSFYQVNPSQMEKLYDTVLEFADLKETRRSSIFTAGVGTIGLYCAQKAKYVWGIESVKSAVVDANRNAVINGLVNIQFISGKAEEDRSSDRKLRAEEEESSDGKKGDSPADIVIVDPPRAGCKPELLRAVMEAAPEKIIYVSCDPGTLMRDLNYLTGRKLFESGMEKTERERSTGNHQGRITVCPPHRKQICWENRVLREKMKSQRFMRSGESAR